MNKTELTAKIYEQHKEKFRSKRDATAIVDSIFDTIMDSVAGGDTVSISGFGTYKVKQRSAKKGVNIRTREPIDIPATAVPKFTPYKTFKDKVSALVNEE